MPNDASSIRVASCGRVHIVHQFVPPNFEQAKAECAAFHRLAERWGSASVLMMFDKLLPVASPDVRAVYRHSVESGPSVDAWVGVVGGAVGVAASIATSIASQVFARRQAVPMRVCRKLPDAAVWLVSTCQTGASVEELVAVATALRQR